MTSVDEYKFDSNFDVIKNLQEGMYSNRLLTHDLVRMKYDTLDFNYMHPENTEKKVTEDDDPERCQAGGVQGQCRIKKLKGSDYCVIHAGGQKQTLENENKRMYRLTKYRARLDELGSDSQIKGLREEIGLLRIVMEEIINSCHDTQTLLASTHKITDTAVKIEKLVTSCNRLEKSLGNYLDKNDVIQLGNEIVSIISEEVSDKSAIEKIAARMVAVIERMTSSEEKD